MTKQITIKLNYEQFRPLLDHLEHFSGTGISDSDSDLAGKALFYCYRTINKKHPSIGKTTSELVTEAINIGRAEQVLDFLNDYYNFKKEGLKKAPQKNNGSKKLSMQ